jgi:outer membrane immunogenic protein
MKYLLAGTIALFAFASVNAAYAADMPVKALPPAPVQYDWTGFYAGGNIGYAVGSGHSSETLTFPNGTQFSGETFTLTPAGALGGLQAGGNVQRGNWVMGVEGDWQVSSQKASICIQTCSVGTGPLNEALTVGQNITWLATLRGRLGYADGAFLWYLTGGGALGRVESNDVAQLPTVAAGFDHTRSGWTLGGGSETALTGNWTVKLEYLFVDLGTINDAFIAGFGNTEAIHAGVHENIVRLGLNYRIAGATGSALPSYATASSGFNWTGFYIGATAGHGVGHNNGNENLAAPPFFPAVTAQTFAHAPTGWPVGPQAGYNWQTGNWVAGLEGDWQWTHQRDSIAITMGTPASNLNGDGFTLNQTLSWLATLRGRVGYDHQGWLWYVTGGAAWGGVANNDILKFGALTAAASFNHTQSGWTVGTGIEKVITGHWTAKFEYLYVNLGAIMDSFTLAPGAVETVHQNITDNIIRLGLNYHF